MYTMSKLEKAILAFVKYASDLLLLGLLVPEKSCLVISFPPSFWIRTLCEEATFGCKISVF